jgi:hypothetical protein
MAKKKAVVADTTNEVEAVNLSASEIAAVAFAEHAHVKKVWISEEGHFYLAPRKNCVAVEREEV